MVALPGTILQYSQRQECPYWPKIFGLDCSQEQRNLKPYHDGFQAFGHFLYLVLRTITKASLSRIEKQRDNEELRKKRLAFVGISLDNVLPARKPKKAEIRENYDSETEEDETDVESEESGPIYQLRQRSTTQTSYRYVSCLKYNITAWMYSQSQFCIIKLML